MRNWKIFVLEELCSWTRRLLHLLIHLGNTLEVAPLFILFLSSLIGITFSVKRCNNSMTASNSSRAVVALVGAFVELSPSFRTLSNGRLLELGI